MAQPPAEERGPAEEPADASGLPGSGAGTPDSEPQAADASDAGPGSAACLPPDDPAPDCGTAGRTTTPGGAGAPSGAAGPDGATGPGAAGGSETGPGAAGGGRDPRLAGFGEGGAGDACPPSAALAAVVAELSGPGWRCA
ncbi:MAG TPA: hypothetical protein VH589_22270, partial [Trebonia sp.]